MIELIAEIALFLVLVFTAFLFISVTIFEFQNRQNPFYLRVVLSFISALWVSFSLFIPIYWILL